MYVKRLTISTESKLIRDIQFHQGLNIITDVSEKERDTQTGNNVGKTTVLRLIDFCLGASYDKIYRSSDTDTDTYFEVEHFLKSEGVVVGLFLGVSFDNEDNDIVLQRNFHINRELAKNFINGEEYEETNYKSKLREILFPSLIDRQPSLRQLISHNIRYDEIRLASTLKTLGPMASASDYECMYLYLFNCEKDRVQYIKEIKKQLNLQKAYSKVLSEAGNLKILKEQYKLTCDRIEKAKSRLGTLYENNNKSDDVKKLKSLRVTYSILVSEVAELDFKIRTITQTQADFKNRRFSDDVSALHVLYNESKRLLPDVSVTFDELIKFHNEMSLAKERFLNNDLQVCRKLLKTREEKRKDIEASLSEYEAKIRSSVTSEQMQLMVNSLNDEYRIKGELESRIKQFEELETRLKELKASLDATKSQESNASLVEQLNTNVSLFNKYFSDLSNRLYGEENKLAFRQKSSGTFEFYLTQPNTSAGRKQGESLCFDIAYIMYANSINFRCLHFLLNDKKELMDGKQLEVIPNIVRENDVQIIISMLFDKLPESILEKKEDYIVLTLSQEDKLFRF